jgi:hypothetical protein
LAHFFWPITKRFVNETQQARELVKTEDATRAIVVGNRVYDPLVFAPTVVQFSTKQYIFLRHYRLGVPLEVAAEKADMTPESAERFLEKESTRKWLEDRAAKDYIKNEWNESAKWWQMGDDVLEGKRELTKGQQVVFKEFGDRVVPKKSEGSPGTTKIEINIDPKAVRDAFVRQEAIEGEIA